MVEATPISGPARVLIERVRDPCQRGSGNVGQRQQGGPGIDGFDRLQGIEGFARLRNRHYQCSRTGRQWPELELGRIVDFGRHAGDCLDVVFADLGGVQRGPAGQQQHPRNLPEGLRQVGQPAQIDVRTTGSDPALDGVGQGARLLEDLLLHEMPVGAALGQRRRPGCVADFAPRRTGAVPDLNPGR